jgi:serine/threonine-protein kinase HipA
VARELLARERGCDPLDHFEMLAACGEDLPGNVRVFPVGLDATELEQLLGAHQGKHDLLATPAPLPGRFSLCGVQPKLSVALLGERYTGSRAGGVAGTIAKLPVAGRPQLPEVEHLSMKLAKAAGVDVCDTALAPLAQLARPCLFDLDDSADSDNFLAVSRYDRIGGHRIHCEDFAQVMGLMPEEKYGWQRSAPARVTYLDVAKVMVGLPSLGEAAVHELLRRLVVNEMLGNIDMHLKNIGVWFPDGVTPELPPAYDIVGYAAYGRNNGHALMILPPDLFPGKHAAGAGRQQRQALSPAVVRTFCAEAGLQADKAAAVIGECVKRAYKAWPSMITESNIEKSLKCRLLEQFEAHPMIDSLARRDRARGSSVMPAPAAPGFEYGLALPAVDVWGEVIPAE